VMAAVEIGHARLADQVVEQVLVGGDGVEHQRIP
jgi:hypothetical protein